MKWNAYDFVECLGVLPEISEFDESVSFSVERNLFSLELTVIDYRNSIGIYIYSTDEEKPFFTLQFIVRDEIIFVKDNKFSYLLFKDCVVVSDDFYSVDDYYEKVSDHDNFPKYIDFELHTFPNFQLKFT